MPKTDLPSSSPQSASRDRQSSWLARAAHSLLVRGLAFWALAFAGVAALSWSHRRAPYFWDGMGYVQPHAFEIYQSGLSPFLRNYDVGHPTLFPWLMAALVKATEWEWTLAGHVLTWVFGALALGGVYGCGRVLGQPRPIAWGSALATMALPVIWANVQLVHLDLPMFAAIMAASYFWARRRPILYMIAATAAILTKLHGFVPLCGVGAAVFLGSGRFWEKGKRWAFLRLTLWSFAPLLTLPAFLYARQLVRGPARSVNYPQPDKMVFLWQVKAFMAHLPFAFKQLFELPLVHVLLMAAVPVVAMGFIALLFRRAKEPLENLFESTPQYNMILVLALMFVGNSLALIQLGAGLCCPRYSMPAAGALTLLIAQSLWFLTRRVWLVASVQAVWIIALAILGHPSRAEALPWPLSSWLRRTPLEAGYHLEIDERFLDATDLISWGGATILKDAQATGSPLGAATQWPATVAFHVPIMGYVKEVVPNVIFEDWGKLNPATHPYVFSLTLIAWFGPPPAEMGAEKIAEKIQGELTAIVWRLPPPAPMPPSPAPEPAAPEVSSPSEPSVPATPSPEPSALESSPSEASPATSALEESASAASLSPAESSSSASETAEL